MDIAVKLLILVALATACWWLFRPRPLFRLRILNGKASVVAGTVTSACIEQVESVWRMHGLKAGSLSGFALHSGRIRLRTSRNVPPDVQQQLRNWWAENGWSGPPTDRPPPKQAVAVGK